MVYLDTHLVLWLYAKELDYLSAGIRTELEQNELFISPIVELEIQLLKERNKVKPSARQIFNFLRKNINLKICHKEFGLVVGQACDINWTRDPFDRLIVAHAALNKNKLLTRDQHILKHYPLAVW